MTLTQVPMQTASKCQTTSGVEWTRLIVEAAQEVFELMVAVKLTPASADRQRGAGVTAMLGFAGAPTGVFSVRCSWDAAADIAARMLGSSPQELASEQVGDALGEICNMVAGSVKTRLPDAGAGCMMSTPTVVRGVDYEVRCLACDCCFSIVMEFDGEAVVFHLELQS
ncbi:MAG: chemotaxis protein CheX [Candidatus Korobacteraceae bacterium]